jgi:hypothetical protein
VNGKIKGNKSLLLIERVYVYALELAKKIKEVLFF